MSVRQAGDMPELVRELADHLRRNPGAYLRVLAGQGDVEDTTVAELTELTLLMRARLEAAHLLWVSEPMANEVCTAAATLGELHVADHDFPSATGLAYFETGWRGGQDQAQALLWSVEADAVDVFVLDELRRDDGDTSRVLTAFGVVPDLVPTLRLRLPIAEDGSLPEDEDESAALRALMSLMYILRSTLPARDVVLSRSERRRMARRGDDPARVQIVHLRAYEKPERPDGGPAATGRRASSRSHVRAYWRKTWFPKHGVHRPQWIAPHVRGPAGAPVVTRDRVTALTR